MIGRGRAVNLLQSFHANAKACPCHGGGGAASAVGQHVAGCTGGALTTSAKPTTDYAFEIATSTIRFGPGVTMEVGHDFANMGSKNVLVMTDRNLEPMLPVTTARQSLDAAGVNYSVYADVRVEPTDSSVKKAIEFAKAGDYDAFLAIGGGSVLDTCKAANLYSTFPDADFLDFVNAPIGKGLPVPGPVKPLVAVPTTAGTGSETTGVSIFDYEPLKAKTGIANRLIRPTLGIVDPLNAKSMPREVAIASGFDVLCHALESYTALPYDKRSPRPEKPHLRPAYQGSNPVSDVWAMHALDIMNKYFYRSVNDPEDMEAKSFMHLASAYAGVGFGNAGVHGAHGCSYPVSGLSKQYRAPGYNVPHPLVPHGISVILNAPGVFRFTAPSDPGRHLKAAEMLGGDVSNARDEDAGAILSDIIKTYMNDLDVPDGLSALGFSQSDIPALVEGTLPQRRVLAIMPEEPVAEDLAKIFEMNL